MSKKSQEDVKAFLDTLIQQAEQAEYIYRGEKEVFDKASSSLYRAYYNIITENFTINQLEQNILDGAKKHFPANTPNVEMLAELQHYGGKTNLIDFSKNLYIALFFACDGSLDKDGRLILVNQAEVVQDNDINYEKPPEKNMLFSSFSKNNRVVFQSSVFVYPPLGYIELEDYEVIKVPSELKTKLLTYLKKYHDIHRDTIYNDLQGFISNQENYESASMEFYKGLSAQKASKNDKAIEHYTTAIKLKPDFAAAYNNRGVAKYELEQYKEAIKDYDQAIKLKPDFAEAYNNRGNAKVRLGQLEEAIKDRLGQYEAAIKDYNQAIKLNPDFAEAYNNRGLAKARLEQYNEAITDYDQAITLKPDYAEAYNNRGRAKTLIAQNKEAIEEAIKDFDQAIKDLDQAITLKPDLEGADHHRKNAMELLNCLVLQQKEAMQRLKNKQTTDERR